MKDWKREKKRYRLMKKENKGFSTFSPFQPSPKVSSHGYFSAFWRKREKKRGSPLSHVFRYSLGKGGKGILCTNDTL
jgi:hypothetical protein